LKMNKTMKFVVSVCLIVLSLSYLVDSSYAKHVTTEDVLNRMKEREKLIQSWTATYEILNIGRKLAIMRQMEKEEEALLAEQDSPDFTRKLIELSKRQQSVLKASYTVTGTISVVLPDKVEIKEISPIKRTIIMNAKEIRRYTPHLNQVEIISLPKRLPSAIQIENILNNEMMLWVLNNNISKFLQDYNINLKGSKKVRDTKVYVLEALPKDTKSFYTKIEFWVDAEKWVIIDALYYYETGLFKSYSFRDVKLIDDRIWMPTKISSITRFELALKDIQINTEIPDDAFILENPKNTKIIPSGKNKE